MRRKAVDKGELFRRPWWRASERFAEPGDRFPLGMRLQNPRCWLCESCYATIADRPWGLDTLAEATALAEACVGNHHGSGLSDEEVRVIRAIADGDFILGEAFNSTPEICARILAGTSAHLSIHTSARR